MDRRSLLVAAGGFGFTAFSGLTLAQTRARSSSDAIKKLLDSAREQSTVTKSYDPRYVQIAYPGGDVQPETGVCSDVIIRAFRAVAIDLQKLVHEDMREILPSIRADGIFPALIQISIIAACPI